MIANGHHPLPVETARALLGLGIHTVPVKHGAKTVQRDGWIHERWEAADLDMKFGGDTNIGILLGDASERLADCDLDTTEAVVCAAHLLPPTAMIWGRPGKPRSHYGYQLDHVGPKNLQFKDPTAKRTDSDAERRAMLCELRIRGQTIGPGSLHPNGEIVDWDTAAQPPYRPAALEYDTLKRALGQVAACALVARYWSDGIRHDASLALAGMFCRGALDENQATNLMRVICLAAGDPELDNRVASVSDTYARALRGEPFVGGATLEEFWDPKIVTRIRTWLDLTQAAYTGDIGPDGWPLNDIGNAERFAAKWAHQAVYCADESAWYFYTGKRWERDRKGIAYRRAIEVVNEFRNLAYSAATISRGNTTPDQWKRHADQFGKLKQIRAMLDLAGSMLPTVPEDFDADPLVLNVQNGTLEFNLQSGEVYLREFRADDMLTMIAGVGYNPGACAEEFDEFLRLFFPEDERRAFLQLHSAQPLTGLPKRYALQLIGPTNAGKSMTLDLFGRVLGDYADTLKYDSLMRNQHRGGDVPRADLWNVRNKRLVTVAEIPPDAVYDVALFKSLLSGGDKQRVRNLYDRTGGASVAFSFALWTSGNAPYGPPGEESAAYERLHVLWCLHSLDRTQRDERKQQRTLDLAVTGESVLLWMTQGFSRLYGELGGRLIPPDFVVEATNEIQNDKDPWSGFFDTGVVAVTGNDNDGVLKAELWAEARQWYELHNGRITSVRKAQWDFDAAVTRRVGASRQSSRRWNNRDYYPGLVWDQGLIDKKLVTPPDWQRQ